MRTNTEKLLDYSGLNITEVSEMSCPLNADNCNYWLYKTPSPKKKRAKNLASGPNLENISPSLRYGEEVDLIVQWIKKKQQEIS